MKFKVGDKVRVIGDSLFGEFKIGEIGVVSDLNYICYDKLNRLVVDFEDSSNGLFRPEKLELIEPKKSKNQRITELESKVEQLEKHSSIIPKLIGRIESLEFVLAENSKITSTDVIRGWDSVMKESELTPNQQRAEIIEKAKKFVEQYGALNIEFVVNEKERTVLAIWYKHKDVKSAFTKCHPNDVFNEFIGKAIALGRLLEMSNVSEFEQAVQPNEIEIGMVVEGYSGHLPVAIESDKEHLSLNYARRMNYKILNDTNAQYGGAK